VPAYVEWEKELRRDTTVIEKKEGVTVTAFALSSLPPYAQKFLKNVNELSEALSQGEEQGFNLVLSYEKANRRA